MRRKRSAVPYRPGKQCNSSNLTVVSDRLISMPNPVAADTTLAVCCSADSVADTVKSGKSMWAPATAICIFIVSAKRTQRRRSNHTGRNVSKRKQHRGHSTNSIGFRADDEVRLAVQQVSKIGSSGALRAHGDSVCGSSGDCDGGGEGEDRPTRLHRRDGGKRYRRCNAHADVLRRHTDVKQCNTDLDCVGTRNTTSRNGSSEKFQHEIAAMQTRSGKCIEHNTASVGEVHESASLVPLPTSMLTGSTSSKPER